MIPLGNQTEVRVDQTALLKVTKAKLGREVPIGVVLASQDLALLGYDIAARFAHRKDAAFINSQCFNTGKYGPKR